MTAEHRPETPQEEIAKQYVPEDALPAVFTVFENHENLLSQFHVGEPAFIAFGHYLQHMTLENYADSQDKKLQADPQNIAVQLRYVAALNDVNALDQRIYDLRLSVAGYAIAYDETDVLLSELDEALQGSPQVHNSFDRATRLLEHYRDSVEQTGGQDTAENTINVTVEEI